MKALEIIPKHNGGRVSLRMSSARGIRVCLEVTKPPGYILNWLDKDEAKQICDWLIKYFGLQGDTIMSERTIPTKDQVLKAAKDCPETTQALKILFPKDFEPEWAPPVGYQDYGVFMYRDAAGSPGIFVRKELLQFGYNRYAYINKDNPIAETYTFAPGMDLSFGPSWIQTRDYLMEEGG